MRVPDSIGRSRTSVSQGLQARVLGARPRAIRNGIEDAVKLTLRADVPVGIAGGIDSGAIAVLAQKHYPEPMHAFCVGYPGRPAYDERHQARALAKSLGMIVHKVELPVDSFVDFFPQLVRIMDEPIADPAAFGHYSVPKAAADQGIKVLLSGIGGDEIFWGYHWVTKAVRQPAHPKATLALGHCPGTWLNASAELFAQGHELPACASPGSLLGGHPAAVR